MHGFASSVSPAKTAVQCGRVREVNEMKTTKYGLHCVLILGALVWGVAAARGAPGASPHAADYGVISAFEKANRPDLEGEINRHGEVRVIVGLATPRHTGGTIAQSQGQLRTEMAREQDDLVTRMSSHGARHIKKVRSWPYVVMHVNQAGLQQLLADPSVQSVATDEPLHLTLFDTPTILHAISAWNAGFTGAGQYVAILDSGVDGSHPLLSGKVTAEACFSSGGSQPGETSFCPNGQSSEIGAGAAVPCPSSYFGCFHGTHVAGIATGKRGVIGDNQNAGGMAPDAKLIPVQVFSGDCSTGTCNIVAYTSDLLMALDYIYSLRDTYPIASINMSLGGTTLYTSACDSVDPAITSAYNSLKNAGIATVVASGNDSGSSGISFPACISTVVSVGATDKSNFVANFSNSSSELDLLATGVSVYSSLPGGTYGYLSGTSMAAPHVAGAWAVMKSAVPNLGADAGLAALKSTGLPITDARNEVTVPLIQIGAAVDAVLNSPFTVSLTAPADNATFTAPATITLTATAADADGIDHVEFYQGSSLLGTATAAPAQLIPGTMSRLAAIR